jgi:hypothetical protein
MGSIYMLHMKLVSRGDGKGAETNTIYMKLHNHPLRATAPPG